MKKLNTPHKRVTSIASARFFIIFLALVFLFNFTSAQLEFNPNVPKYGEISIDDWLIFNKADYRLLNYDCSLIDCYAEGEYKLYKKTHLFQDVYFKDLAGNTKQKETKFYIWKEDIQYLNIDDYQDVCTNNATCTKTKVGNHTEIINKSGWIPYNKNTDLDESTGKWRIETKRKVNEKLDFILQAHGYDFTPWAWWNNSWYKKVAINITVTSGYTGVDYPVRLNITYDSDMLANFSDIRFTDSAETTELPFFKQNYSSSLWGLFWVNVSNNITTTNQTIYMYYKNAGATSDNSNGSKVFTFFDDFSTGTSPSTSLWNTSGTITVSGGEAQIENGEALYTKLNYSVNYSLIVRTKGTAKGYDCGMWYGGSTSYVYMDAGTDWLTAKTDNGLNSNLSVAVGSNIYRFCEINRVNQTYSLWSVDDISKLNSSTTNTTVLPMYYRVYVGGVTQYIDWALIRKSRTAEPISYFGSEQNITLNATVTNIAPANNTQTVDTTLNFQCNATDELGVYSLNLTINGTTYETVTGNGTTNLSLNSNETLSTGLWLWNCTANDNTYTSSSNYSYLNISQVVVNSETYANNVTEGSEASFTINVTSNGTALSLAYVSYNGTLYLGSYNSNGYTYNASVNVTAPGVVNYTNVTFFWYLIFSDGYSFNYTSHNQTILNMSIDNCSTGTIRLANFTLLDEGLQTQIVNGTIEVSILVYDSSKTNLVLNYSTSTSTSNPLGVCLVSNLTSSDSYLMDGVIRYYKTGYANEYYNIENYTLNSTITTQNITLYDLNSSDSTEFQLTFKDSDYLISPGTLIYVNRQYVSENAFKTVELPKTDSNGQAVIHLVRNDIIYNLVAVKNGEVIGNLNNIVAFCEDQTIGLCVINFNAIGNSTDGFNYYDELGIIAEAPSYNSATKIFTMSFVTSDGSSKTVNLTVERANNFGTRVLCSSSVTSSSGSLTCDTSTYNTDNSTLVSVVRVNGLETLVGYTAQPGAGYGVFGYLVAMVLTLAFIIMLGSSSKEGVIIGAVAGLLASIGLGVIKGGILGLGAVGIWAIVVGIIFLWKLNRGKIQ